MTTNEHLDRISAKCSSLLETSAALREFAGCVGDITPPAEAGWRSTIAAIDSIKRRNAEEKLESIEIRAAWPEELL